MEVLFFQMEILFFRRQFLSFKSFSFVILGLFCIKALNSGNSLSNCSFSFSKSLLGKILGSSITIFKKPEAEVPLVALKGLS